VKRAGEGQAVAMTQGAEPVFLLDVDNTLLNNDRLKEEIDARVLRCLSSNGAALFWNTYESVRQEQDHVDYPLTIQRVSELLDDPTISRELHSALFDFPFKDYVYAGSLDTIRYLDSFGTPVILSDGDAVYQPHKIKESGLAEAVGHRVMVVAHKERELPKVFAAFPAPHYCAIDDKPTILAALEQDCPSEFTTVFVLQGKYARQKDVTPRPDITVSSIADVRSLTRSQLTGAETSTS